MVIPPSQGLENENKGDFQYYPIMLGFQKLWIDFTGSDWDSQMSWMTPGKVVWGHE